MFYPPFHHRTGRRIVLAAALFGLVAIGCDRKADDTSRSREEATARQSDKQASDDGDETAIAETDAGDEKRAWKQVDEEGLGETSRAKLERARGAQKALGSTLKKELTRAVSEKSFSGAVEFCRDRAPEIAEEVAEKRGVAIGRTSHRLRNPDNNPPAWARPAVERKEARQYIYQGPDQQLGYLKPIKLGGLCTNCHGTKDQLADGVPEALGKYYPKDQATGFEPGDLRGWFWVEVKQG
jgi:hypothetical protein